MIGLARYTSSLLQAMQELNIDCQTVAPQFPWPIRSTERILARFGYDLRAFFLTYPISAKFNRDIITHLPAQQMTTLLWRYPRLQSVVVTVHDIIPFLVRQNAEQSTFRHPFDVVFDKLAMEGLKRSDAIISVSNYTKKTITEVLNYSPERVYVVHEGVTQEIFRPRNIPSTFYHRYRLDPETPYILFVGSENPRKNLPLLIDAFSQIIKADPSVKLLKVGSSEYLPQAEMLKKKIFDLDLEEKILFFEHISDEDLAYFYNLADLFVFPSLFEGFGLPPLEAMACGTPVVCSNAASLPEVVGDAALMIDPYDVDMLAEAMQAVLSDEALRKELREKGLRRAAEFTWQRTAQETIKVYRQMDQS